MAVIIDANRAGDFSRPPKNHAPEIVRRINKKKVRVVIGGLLTKELAKTAIAGQLIEWRRSGMVTIVNEVEIDSETKLCRAMSLVSDDPHILALARISGTRLLYTDDNNLILDFRNKAIVFPRGRIMKTTTPIDHAAVLLDRLGH